MATAEDLAAWESQLMEELEGLRECQQRVSEDKSIPLGTKTRFRDILKSLNRSVSQVLSRTKSLRSLPLEASEFSSKASLLQRDYRHILRNITQLLHTIDPLPAPPRPSTPPDPLFDLSQLSTEFVQLQRMTAASRTNLDEHVHSEMETQLREVRAENDQLNVRLQTMEEEQNDMVKVAEALQERIALLEKRTGRREQEAVPRLIAKRVGEAEKYLRR